MNREKTKTLDDMIESKVKLLVRICTTDKAVKIKLRLKWIGCCHQLSAVTTQQKQNQIVDCDDTSVRCG